MKPSFINILIACEESQAECSAFRARGFNAWSCDVQLCRHHPEWHICGDVTPYLQGRTQFITQDGRRHRINKWHMIIAHPPCTYLTKAGAVQMVHDGQVDQERYQKMLQAREFFFKCLDADAPFVAVENPIPMRRAMLPRPDTYLCPSWFGVKYTKKTLLWLRNLPPIMPEIINPNTKCFVTSSRGKYRSRTFPQIARAMAVQWGDYVQAAMDCNDLIVKHAPRAHSPGRK